MEPELSLDHKTVPPPPGSFEYYNHGPSHDQVTVPDSFSEHYMYKCWLFNANIDNFFASKFIFITRVPCRPLMHLLVCNCNCDVLFLTWCLPLSLIHVHNTCSLCGTNKGILILILFLDKLSWLLQAVCCPWNIVFSIVFDDYTCVT